ncbi:MAG: hypothetical protein ACI4VH_07520 [Clostridia bacterium]
MLVNKIMQVLKNLFGLNKKISASEIAIKDSTGVAITLDKYLKNRNIYSTEEQIVGTWLDGKPLYQKVFVINGSVNSESTNEFAHNISFVDFIFIKNAFVSETVNNKTYSLPVVLYENNTNVDKLCIKVDRNNITFFSQTGWGNTWIKYVILNYTKTTD